MFRRGFSNLIPSFRAQKDDEEVIVKNMALLMYETGWSIQSLKQMPLSTFIVLAEELSKNAKEMERKSKKKGRH